MSIEDNYTTEYVEETLIIKPEHLDDLCRLCANTDNQLMPIFSGEGAEHNIINKIKQHLPIIKVTEHDNLPLNICYHCASNLIAWHNLYEGCKAADARLRQLFGEVIKTDQDDEEDAQYEHFGYDDETLDYNDDSGEHFLNNIIQLSPTSGDIKTAIEYDSLEDAVQEVITQDDIPEENDLVIDCDNQNVIIGTEGIEIQNLTEEQLSGRERDPLRLKTSEKNRNEPKRTSADSKIINTNYDKNNLKGLRKLSRNKKLKSSSGCGSNSNNNNDNDNASNGDNNNGDRSKTSSVNNIHDGKNGDKRDDVYKCFHCGQKFEDRKRIITHMRTTHKDKVDSGSDVKQTFICYCCGRSFTNKVFLEHHMIAFHIERKGSSGGSNCVRGYCCEVCHQGFVKSSDMFSHRERVHSLPELSWSKYMRSIFILYYCVQCEKYYRKSEIRHHRCVRDVAVKDEDCATGKDGKKRDSPPAKRYFCDVCGLRFIWKCSLRLHRDMSHLDAVIWSDKFLNIANPKFICERCDRAFSEEQLFRNHDCTIIPDSDEDKHCLVKRYSCFVCSKYFAYRKDLFRHVHYLHPESRTELEKKYPSNELSKRNTQNTIPFKCAECDFTSCRRKDLLEHLKRTHDIVTDSPFYCSICRKLFKKSQSYISHMNITHPKDETDEERKRILSGAEIKINGQTAFHCNQCNRNIFQEVNFLVHYRSHQAQKNFRCDQCGKQARSRYYLQRHINIVHLNIRNFACDLCGKDFNRKQALIEHRRIHTGERPYTCETCGNTFVAMNNLISHRKFHNDYYPHACHLCEKKFKLRRTLENHVRTHTGERPFKCDLCPKTFNNSSRYSYHKKVTHSNNRPYRCYICASSFKTMKFLKRHIKLHSVRTHIQVRKRNNPYLYNKLHNENNKLKLPRRKRRAENGNNTAVQEVTMTDDRVKNEKELLYLTEEYTIYPDYVVARYSDNDPEFILPSDLDSVVVKEEEDSSSTDDPNEGNDNSSHRTTDYHIIEIIADQEDS